MNSDRTYETYLTDQTYLTYQDGVTSTTMKSSLAGQVAIVTGVSRSKGIGAAIARSLAGSGADLFLTGWPAYDTERPWSEKENRPVTLLHELKTTGIKTEWQPFDLSNPDSARRLISAVEARFGAAHILINNACFSQSDPFENLDVALVDRHYAVNTRGPVLLSIEFVRRYGGKGARRIISMTSGQMLGPMRGELAYVVTKAGLDAFTITFAAEVGHLGITVNAVDPGPTDSGWMTPELQKSLLPRFGLGRLGRPEDAANLVTFLAGPDSDWITGQILRSRGGFE
jgi:3-oxoacyl-[acyl-carrier protein] reductase